MIRKSVNMSQKVFFSFVAFMKAPKMPSPTGKIQVGNAPALKRWNCCWK